LVQPISATQRTAKTDSGDGDDDDRRIDAARDANISPGLAVAYDAAASTANDSGGEARCWHAR
jgi:hypothetical protein